MRFLTSVCATSARAITRTAHCTRLLSSSCEHRGSWLMIRPPGWKSSRPCSPAPRRPRRMWRKGLLFSQRIRYEPLRHDRRARLEELRTGDGRVLPEHMKRQISRELDRLELLLAQIKAVEAERNTMLAKTN